MTQPGVVVVGAGQGGFQIAASLRENGYTAPVTLVGDEPHLPYQRPPLSKTFIKGDEAADALAFRPAAFFEKHGIALRLGQRAAAIDRTGGRIGIGRDWLAYDHLVLATGARNRPLHVPGAELRGVVALRGAADGLTLRAALQAARNVVIVGGGFLGLEVAAAARAKGAAVHLMEAGERLMGRAVSAAVSDYFLAHHRDHGITIALGQTVSAITGDGHADGVRTTEGEHLPADLVVVAIGVVPNTELAEAAGIAVDRGIVVDHGLLTSDPHIHALGDCALYPSVQGGGMLRLESVQNAVDQARCVAAGILGDVKPYDAVPWFWSDQGPRLQIAGLTAGADDTVVKGEGDAFSVYCFRNSVFVGVESINRPADHVKARRLLAGPAPRRAEF